MATRDTHSKEETQNCPCPFTYGHAVRSSHPRFLLRHCGPYWQRYECFCESFFTIQGGNTQSQNSATAKPAGAAIAKPPANTGAKKPRASGLRKR